MSSLSKSTKGNVGRIPTSTSSSDDDSYLDSSRYSLPEPIHALAARALIDAKTRFHEQMSPSLHAEIAYHERDCVAPFNWNECRLGPLLGSGEFSDVFEIKSFCLEKCHSQSVSASKISLSEEEIDQRLSMKSREKHGGTKKSRYALKHIKAVSIKTHRGRSKYYDAACDLALEKELLSSLVHPHIIKIRGVTTSGPTGFALIIDCLDETLDQALKRWRNPSLSKRVSYLGRSVSNMSLRLNKRRARPVSKVGVRSNTLDHCLSVALQISAALKYLHSHQIIYRDLKPANIGFDVRGDVKLFDFGLARFIPENGDPNISAFEMSSAGTPRYMSPECLSQEAYNLKSDVYAFAIILWEILSGQTPYIFARNRHQLFNFVVKDHGRPEIDPTWPKTIQSMLESCFEAEMGRRPEMKHVYDDIRELLDFLRGGGRNSLDDEWISRRRSVASIDG